jgi:ferredoxin like protein
MNIDAKLGLNVFKISKESHIIIKNEICREQCQNKPCLYVCPADLYEVNDEGQMVVNYEGCLECGTCLICCDQKALEWRYPTAEFGVQYRLG